MIECNDSIPAVCNSGVQLGQCSESTALKLPNSKLTNGMLML